MKSTELRLGNRIIRVDNLGNKKEIIVTASIFSEMEVRCGVVYLPIPLNEEWLLKFGFESNKEFTYTKNFNAVELYDECIEFFFEPNEEVCITLRQMESDNHNEISSVFIRKIMYVHQLQNLYFALTGEELIIKQ